MTKYISLYDAICIADYAVDEHPYDKIPDKPETFSDYNRGWHDACDFIKDGLEALNALDAVPIARCKDCRSSCPPKDHHKDKRLLRCDKPGSPCYNRLVWENDFCSYGKREEQNE